MALYEFKSKSLSKIEPTTFQKADIRERDDLQRVLRDHFQVIDEDVLIVAEEFSGWTDSNRRIDLLGVDRQGQLVVVELKRSNTGGTMELQALRYAAMIRAMTLESVVDVFERYLRSRGNNGDGAEEALLEHLDNEDKEDFGSFVRIILIAADFNDRELTSTVLWLREHEIDIQCIRLNPYLHDGKLLLDIQRIIPLPETTEYEVQLKEKASEERRARQQRAGNWTGYYFANVGMDSPNDSPDGGRHWENCRKWGYLAAGGAARFSRRLKNLRIGDSIFAYVSKAGYVGVGTVVREAEPVHQLRLQDGRLLTDVINTAWGRNTSDDTERWEYAVRVNWLQTVSIEEAKKYTGISALPTNVYKLKDQKTVHFLCEEFGVSADNR
ncbi:MAG: DUF91 domain-containing protein [Phycisphaerales bacterium]|nr:MAG: DUF91 domain-containing protein [Phycisphaerales bacterium]